MNARFLSEVSSLTSLSLLYDMYISEKSKTAVVEPEVHISQLIDMAVDDYNGSAYVFGNGQVSESESNHVTK